MEKPLRGVRVIEVAMWVAGPSTAAVLADWGADVIKLESPNGGDPIRGMSTRAMGDDEVRGLAVNPDGSAYVLTSGARRASSLP